MGKKNTIQLNGVTITSPLVDHGSLPYEVFKNMNTEELPLNCRFDLFGMDSLIPKFGFLPTAMIQNAGGKVVVFLDPELPEFCGNTQAELRLVSSVRKALIMENSEFKPELIMYSTPIIGSAFEFFVYRISLVHSTIETVLTQAFKFNSEVEEKLERLFGQDLKGSCKELIIPGKREGSYKKITSSEIAENYFLDDEE